MEFVHCPGCRYAFDATRSSACPRCERTLGAAPPAPRDAESEVDLAIARLGHALGRLDDAALDRLTVRLVSAEHADPWAALVAGAIAGAIASRRAPGLVAVTEPEPAAPPPTERERLLISLALALLARLAAAANRLTRRRPL